MSARDTILARVRRACSPAGAPATTGGPSEPVTAYTLGATRAELVDHFCLQAANSGAAVQRLQDRCALQRALFAQCETVPGTVVDEAVLALFPDLVSTSADEAIPCTIARAAAAIAETGTLCLDSGHIASRRLFLCEQLVVLLDEAAILPHPEAFWRRHTPPLPRAIHLVTGPSRTADVEQTIQIGAHGPRTLTILLHPPL